MSVVIDGDVILRGVASQVCDRYDPTASASDVAAALTATDPHFVTWTIRAPTPTTSLQRPTRVTFTAQVIAHGYTRGGAKELAADFVDALYESVGRVFAGVEVKSAKCPQLPAELRFDGQSTTHNRFIMNVAVTAAAQ